MKNQIVLLIKKIRHWNLERMNEIIIKKTAYLGIFSAIAIIFGYVESLFPLGIPGVKLGLANLVIAFFALFIWGKRMLLRFPLCVFWSLVFCLEICFLYYLALQAQW